MKRTALAIITATLVFAGCSSSGSSSGSASKSGSGNSSSTSTSKDGRGAAAESSIPASAAIDDLLNGSDPKRVDVINKCNILATVVLGNEGGLDNDPNVKQSLTALVTAVRPYDPAVADALAKNAKVAAAWCKATGMTNV